MLHKSLKNIYRMWYHTVYKENICPVIFSWMMEWCFYPQFCAGDNLGEWDEFWYETCPRCRIVRSTCSPAVQCASTVKLLPPPHTLLFWVNYIYTKLTILLASLDLGLSVGSLDAESLFRLIILVINKHEDLNMARRHTGRKPQTDHRSLPCSNIQPRLLELHQVRAVCLYL